MRDFEGDSERELPRGIPGKGAVTNAEWMTLGEVTGPRWRYERKARLERGETAGQLFLGYRYIGGKGVAIGTEDNRHVLLCAGSRAGKTVSFLAPALMTYPYGIVTLDPKGELAGITARYRAEMGQDVFILDPFGVSGAARSPALKGMLARFNPLDGMDINEPRVVDDARVLAEAMIHMPDHGDRHWAEAAQMVLQAIILLVLATAGEKERHLGTVRNILMGRDRVTEEWNKGRYPVSEALWEMMRSFRRMAFGVIAGTGAALLEMGDKERGSVLSAARTQTAFLDSPELQAILSSSSFRLAELKTGRAGAPASPRRYVTMYLCLPASMMGSHGRWMRLMIELALIAFERTRVAMPAPVLFILEELCTTIGYSRQLENAAGLMAGHGVKLVSVIQDLSQIKGHYARSWETFIGNSGTLIFFGNSDATTLDYVSKKLGTSSFVMSRPANPSPAQLLQGAKMTAEEIRSEPLLTPSELERFLRREAGRAVILPAGEKPFYVDRANYYEDPAFAGKWDPPR